MNSRPAAQSPRTATAARSAAADAVRNVGLEPGEVKLVRYGTRAVFRPNGSDVLARVAMQSDRADAIYELEVGRWLATVGVSADQPWPDSGVYDSRGLVTTL